jgi:LAGLIDADG-like domain
MHTSKIQQILTKQNLEHLYAEHGSLQKIANELGIHIETITKYMKKLEVNYMVNSRGDNKYSCDKNIFKEENERAFYLAGFIAADGSVQNRKYSDVLKIALSIKDLDHLQKLKSLFEATHPIHIFKNKKHPHAELTIVSTEICNDLKKFNIVQNKTFIYTFPEWLFSHPLVNHFMRGYMDGDGTWAIRHTAKNRNVKQSLFSIIGTENLVQSYKTIIEDRCNFISKAKTHKRRNIYNLVYYGNQMVSKIFNFIYKDATIYLDRKYQIAKQSNILKSHDLNIVRHKST